MRSYSTSARRVLASVFEKLGQPGARKSASQQAEAVAAARELGVAPDVAAKAYDAARPFAPANQELSPAERRKQAEQADIEMFGPPRSNQYRSSDFQYDDLPSLAHLQLEEHRSARELIRSAAYELPLLAQYRTAYRPPTALDSLKFSYRAFPNEPENIEQAKVTLAFKPSSVDLPGDRQHTLKLLAGRRYDPKRDEIKLSSSVFGTQAQNKRHLLQTYARLIEAARRGDAFTDVELDLRHARRKERARLAWPTNWN